MVNNNNNFHDYLDIFHTVMAFVSTLMMAIFMVYWIVRFFYDPSLTAWFFAFCVFMLLIFILAAIHQYYRIVVLVHENEKKVTTNIDIVIPLV
jgi:hypothetical protein